MACADRYRDGEARFCRTWPDFHALISLVLVLNERARMMLAPFLLQFGQLLELDCQGSGEVCYFRP